MDKRGVSSVISIVLIILVVLVAVAIVSVSVYTFINSASGEIESFSLTSLDIIDGTIYHNESADSLSFDVKRGNDNDRDGCSAICEFEQFFLM